MFRQALVFIIIFISISVTAQDIFKENILTKFKGQKDYLLSCIDLLDEEDLAFKPSEEEMNTRDLILHMGSNMLWISRDYMQGGDYQKMYDRKDLTKEELTNHMESLFDYAISTLDDYPVHKLKTRVDFFAGEKNMMQLVELMDDHMTHHKGALTVYMRLVGKKAPRFVGW